MTDADFDPDQPSPSRLRNSLIQGEFKMDAEENERDNKLANWIRPQKLVFLVPACHLS